MPLLDRVLVQRVKAEAKTASGIFLPESSVKDLNEGKVLAVGPGGLDREGKRVPMGVQAGDRVLIPTVSRTYILDVLLLLGWLWERKSLGNVEGAAYVAWIIWQKYSSRGSLD